MSDLQRYTISQRLISNTEDIIVVIASKVINITVLILFIRVRNPEVIFTQIKNQFLKREPGIVHSFLNR